MPTQKKKASRKKAFIVFGRFESVEGGAQIVVWQGTARSMRVALRRAALELWLRKEVRWKHHLSVNLTIHSSDLLTHHKRRPA